jgi:hypothetical protein
VGHLQHDFDTGTHLFCFFLYVTVVLWRHITLYPKSPIGIMPHPIQERKEWLVIRAGFDPKDAFDRLINPHFPDHDVNQILAPFLG